MNLPFHTPWHALASFVLAGFAVLAAMEFRRAREWPRRVWAIPLIYVSSLAALAIAVCGAMFGAAPPSAAFRLSGELLGEAIPELAVAFVFFAAALSQTTRPMMPLLPIVDRVLAARAGERTTHRARSAWLPALEATVYAALMLLFSMVWLRIAAAQFHARVAPEQAEALRAGAARPMQALILLNVSLLVLAPFVEEVVFRGFIQQTVAGWCDRPFLRAWVRADRVLPIVLTAALWALVHKGIIAPDWVKWVQIFGVGVLFGAARYRLGLEACVALHLLFNCVGGFYAPPGLLSP